MYEFDHEEETLQTYAETAEKVTISEASALPSVVTTGKTQISRTSPLTLRCTTRV